MTDNLIPRKSYSNIDREAEDAFPSRESGGKISVKSERLLKLKALERTGKIMNLVSQRLFQDENALEVKETAKSPERKLSEFLQHFCCIDFAW